jgi:hypothetical protein
MELVNIISSFLGHNEHNATLQDVNAWVKRVFPVLDVPDVCRSSGFFYGRENHLPGLNDILRPMVDSVVSVGAVLMAGGLLEKGGSGWQQK